jgi:hypothetical protein
MDYNAKIQILFLAASTFILHERAFLCQGGSSIGVFGRFPCHLDNYTAYNGIFLSRR